ncbi:hypothetical protein BKA04_002097 [Cryobacterium mesophilum]|uniref:Uncharacterized protein n=1 Tax=Terrimesophilobacter mesophilus TaxID=433647 RepID=A0A4R8VEF8_9MICO|nr:hypothetical protein [Terrimesophilobacter mesophilus]MBB5633874.1 hypothetical protein [Terrimesophilobacter mesophilus]TFB80550.1 hypothetical protein E3N84_11195 [Terrimesophilobacter mesophilus]
MAKSNKKVVRVESTGDAETTSSKEPVWTPTAESKSKAGRFRIIAAVLWVLALGTEAFAIFWLLRQKPFETWHLILLIGLIVVIGILASVGSVLWKKANRFDPASKQDKVRFFVQNQLGAIITILAFLPLIIMIFLNKDMDGKQKGIAGGIAIVVGLVAVLAFGVDWNAPSQEAYAQDTDAVVFLTGADEVTWTKSGSVYHLCQDASAVNKDSADGQIFVGTTQEAVAAGKSRLTKQLSQEVKECGIDPQKLVDWENQSVTPPTP